jgi:hypothetical protein
MTCLSCAADTHDDVPFDSVWNRGDAEISVYRIEEERYGEKHEGVRIMVFVKEPMCYKSKLCPYNYIKPDKMDHSHKSIEVMKLNDLRKFATGIYGYSAMTSAFSTVEAKKGVPRMATMKVAFTAQEWCGTVYERMVREDRAYQGMLHSYFEGEGETDYTIPHHDAVEAEDNLWISIRELRGTLLAPGTKKKMRIIPSKWSRRKTHETPAVEEVVLKKSPAESRSTALGTLQAHRFSWTGPRGTTRVWVEKAYPHRILSYTEADGSSGTIVSSRREPYWKQNTSAFRYMRDTLQLFMPQVVPDK